MATWFTAFRANMAPSSFAEANMPQGFDINIFILVAVFVVPYISFLLVLAGIRKKRFVSFVAITYQLAIGCMLAVSIVLPFWSIGSAHVETFVKAHSSELTQATISVKVGLNDLNITMHATFPGHTKQYISNEKFDLSSHKSMLQGLSNSFIKGLPLPMIKVLEYFSQHQEGFDWGYKFRRAGHYTNALLCTSIGFWCMQLVCMCLLPHHSNKAMIISGIFNLVGNLVYLTMTPSNLVIPFRGVDGDMTLLIFRFGVCFYLSLACGFLQVFVGVCLLILQLLRLYVIDTIMSSKTMDANVGPSCKHGGIRRKITMVRSRIDDDRIRVSTYISNQIRARNCAQITNEESKVGRINKGICGPQSIVSSDVSLNDKRKIMSASASTGLQSDSSLRSTPASSLESIDNVIHRSISQVVLERPENVDAHDDKFIIQDEGESSDGGSDHSKR